MNILIRSATILDTASPFHRQTLDVFIENGVIKSIGNVRHHADRVVEVEDLHLSPGWVDPFAFFGDPGFEQVETILTGAQAAAAGGFTTVMTLPNTKPAIHNMSMVQYVTGKSAALPVRVCPLGAITVDAAGKELAEMYDMHQSGVVAFSDGLNPLQSSGVMLKALQYVKAIDATIIQIPADNSLAGHGLMNEGVISTRLGLQGKPALAEELMIKRDLELARYAGSRIHFTGISTAESLRIIREAKADGIAVTCSVSPFHLFFTDEDLQGYDTNLKLNPPLRTAADRDALKQGLQDGSVDCIASHHCPRHRDQKLVEFEYAATGMISLETSFALVRTAVPDLEIERVVHLFTSAASIFGLPQAAITEGSEACISLFSPNATWEPSSFQSRSANTAVAGKVLTGRPLGIINKSQLFLND